MKKLVKITPKYAGMMWCLGLGTLGALLTSIVFTLLYILLRHLIIGKMSDPSWTELRIFQTIQIPLVYLLGWIGLKWYFPRTYSFEVSKALVHVKIFKFIPVIVIGVFAATAGSFTYFDKIHGIQVVIALVTFAFLWTWDGYWCYVTLEKSFIDTYKIPPRNDVLDPKSQMK